jgi:hypothetical protein
VIGHRDYVIKVLLHGMTGPIDGRKYPQVMIPMGANKDQWIADVASFVRNAFGNSGPFVTTADVARVRAVTADRKTPWTAEEIDGSVPKLIAVESTWKATVSHESHPAPQPNAAGGFNYQPSPSGAFSYQGWTSGVPQEPGMWFQIELPTTVELMEIQFTSLPIGAGRAGMPPISTYPRAYKVQVSSDGQTWSASVAEGTGSEGTMVITVSPTRAKFVRITQTATAADGAPWSIRQLRLYQAPPR